MTMPKPVPYAHDVESALAWAESCAGGVSQALLAGEPTAISSASSDLHQAALALASALQGVQGRSARTPAFKLRLGKVVRDMAMQREALLRRSAVAELALHSIVPATRASTYGGGGRSYGHNARQSGAFKLLSA